MAVSTNNTRKTLTDLRDTQQIYELNRQLDWVWTKLLGGISKKALTKSCVADLSQSTRDDILAELENGDSEESEFLFALANFIIASVTTTVFQASDLISMLANIFTLTKAQDGSVTISNLVVTSDNISNAISSLQSAIDDLSDALDVVDGKADSAISRLDNLSITASMCDQTVWTEVQRMIDASINGGAT